MSYCMLIIMEQLKKDRYDPSASDYYSYVQISLGYSAHSDWCFFAPCINILTYLLTSRIIPGIMGQQKRTNIKAE